MGCRDVSGSMQSWDGLRERTSGGCRVYTLAHRSLPLQPLAFTSVALTAAAPSRLAPLLHDDDGLVPDDPAAARAAVFFSICSTRKVRPAAACGHACMHVCVRARGICSARTVRLAWAARAATTGACMLAGRPPEADARAPCDRTHACGPGQRGLRCRHTLRHVL